MYEYIDWYAYQDALWHHGIIGQKWGIRRYQNPDGSLTEEGRKRYGISDSVSRQGAYDKVKAPSKESQESFQRIIRSNPEVMFAISKKIDMQIEKAREYGVNRKDAKYLERLAHDLGDGTDLLDLKRFPITASEILDKYPEFEKRNFSDLYKSLQKTKQDGSDRWSNYQSILDQKSKDPSYIRSLAQELQNLVPLTYYRDNKTGRLYNNKGERIN